MPTRCTGPYYRRVRNVVGVGPAPVLAGVSLGALAALHAATTFPGTWAALFLQSGSFFRRESDGHESSFAGFDAITRYVRSLDDATDPHNAWISA